MVSFIITLFTMYFMLVIGVFIQLLVLEHYIGRRKISKEYVKFAANSAFKWWQIFTKE